jgi:hypothetical protein
MPAQCWWENLGLPNWEFTIRRNAIGPCSRRRGQGVSFGGATPVGVFWRHEIYGSGAHLRAQDGYPPLTGCMHLPCKQIRPPMERLRCPAYSRRRRRERPQQNGPHGESSGCGLAMEADSEALDSRAGVWTPVVAEFLHFSPRS